MKYLLLLMTIAVGSVQADEFYVYPSNGQSAVQVEKDKYECYQWASKETGFDPLTTPEAAATNQPSTAIQTNGQTGGVGKSMVVSALSGAVIAEVADGDVAKGAATGATMGVFKGMRRKNHQAMLAQQQALTEAELAAATAQDAQRELRENYQRANEACLKGRGYTVN